MKRKVTSTGGSTGLQGTKVQVAESKEKYCEVTLEDGTVLLAKLTVLDAVRLENRWDPDGTPSYSVRSQNVVLVKEAPLNLLRPSPKSSNVQ